MSDRSEDGPLMEELVSKNPPHSSTARSAESLRRYVERFIDHRTLTERVTAVLAALPDAVLRDLLDDPGFHLSVDNYVPGRGSTVWLAGPGPGWAGSRSVVLKRRLADCPEEFASDVIAHKLAHAHLRNGGWGAIEDREQAADALAKSWGFGRPSSRPASQPAGRVQYGDPPVSGSASK